MKTSFTLLPLLALLSNGCVTLPNVRACSAAVINGGADCAETLTDYSSHLSRDDYFDFLEAQPERPDPDHPGHMLPARAGAICSPAADWTKMKTALEQACHKIKCSKEQAQALETASENEFFAERLR